MERKVIELEITQKNNTERLDKLTDVVEGLSKDQVASAKESEKRIGALMTVTEVHSQQIGLLIFIVKMTTVTVFIAVFGAILKLVLTGG